MSIKNQSNQFIESDNEHNHQNGDYVDKSQTSKSLKKLPIEKLRDFPNQPFKIEAKRLEKMTKSIEKNGIIQSIVVRPIDDDNYEILSGHHRKEAAILAGLTEVPVDIREDLKDKNDEAEILVNETNIAQRSIKEWLHSEKAASISMYHEALKRQGRRTDLPHEISGQDNQKFDARKTTAVAYGVDENIIKRYLQVNKLSDNLKNRLDKKEFGMYPALNLSQMTPEHQKVIETILKEDDSREKDKKIYQVNGKNSKDLREKFGYAKLTNEEIKDILKKTDIPNEKSINIKIDNDKYSQLFTNEQTSEEIMKEFITAIEFYKISNN